MANRILSPEGIDRVNGGCSLLYKPHNHDRYYFCIESDHGYLTSVLVWSYLIFAIIISATLSEAQTYAEDLVAALPS